MDYGKPEKDREKIFFENLRELLKLYGFRNFIGRVMDSCGTYGQPYIPGSFDKTAFKCGQMSIGMMLKSWISAVDPNALPLIEKEFLNELKEEERKRQETEE